MTKIKRGDPQFSSRGPVNPYEDLVTAAFDDPGVWVSAETIPAAAYGPVRTAIARRVADVVYRDGRTYVRVQE